MNIYRLKHISAERIKPNRLVFKGIDAAPPSPENFTSPEKQSMEDRLNEVSAQSPSQIFNDTISAGSAVKTRYANNTSLLASLAGDDPLSANPVGRGGGSSTATKLTTATNPSTDTTTNPATPTPTVTTDQEPKNQNQ